jgi:hypothetical protein
MCSGLSKIRKIRKQKTNKTKESIKGIQGGTEEKENYYLRYRIRSLLSTVNIKFMIKLKYISCKYMINYLKCDWLRNGD